MVYEWKQNRYHIKAQEAGEELERIQNKYGGIEPNKVVDESRSENSVLHNCFEWSDEKAAEQYRAVQAREIIRNIIVVKVNSDDKEEVKPVRAFVSVVADENSCYAKYLSVQSVMSNEDYKQQLYQQALAELKSFKAKYSNLKEFEKLFSEIDQLRIAV